MIAEESIDNSRIIPCLISEGGNQPILFFRDMKPDHRRDEWEAFKEACINAKLWGKGSESGVERLEIDGKVREFRQTAAIVVLSPYGYLSSRTIFL